MFAQRQNRQKTHYSERIPVVKQRISVPAGRHTSVFTVYHNTFESSRFCFLFTDTISFGKRVFQYTVAEVDLVISVVRVEFEPTLAVLRVPYTVS